jgi:hypothetical protein
MVRFLWESLQYAKIHLDLPVWTYNFASKFEEKIRKKICWALIGYSCLMAGRCSAEILIVVAIQ